MIRFLYEKKYTLIHPSLDNKYISSFENNPLNIPFSNIIKVSNQIFKEIFESRAQIENETIGVVITKENLNDYLSFVSKDIGNIVIKDN